MSEETTKQAEDKKTTIKLKPDFSTRDVTLPRSKIVVTIPEDWHISDTSAAQRIGTGDISKTQMALIQRVCLFDGQRLTLLDMENKIGGKDWQFLLGEFYGADEEDEGND